MGGPTSAMFRNLYAVIRDSSHHNSRHPPKFWEHHVDDVFSTIRKTYPQGLLEHNNNLHPQTQLTREEQNNSTLPFLDSLAQRNHDKTILVKIYRKQCIQTSIHTIQHRPFLRNLEWWAKFIVSEGMDESGILPKARYAMTVFHCLE